MLFDFSMVIIFLTVGIVFVFAALTIGSFIRPRRVLKAEKLATYECGEPAIGSGWYNFNPRFYMLALIFLIFDVELVVTFPVIVMLREFAAKGWGFTAYIEILVFVVILVTGLIFLWVRGDLEWIKSIEHSGKEATE